MLFCYLTRYWRQDGLVGHAIGALLYDTLGKWLISIYGYGDGIEAFRHAYVEWGAWIILIKGLTPIPYKIVTIASGFAGYDLLAFTLRTDLVNFGPLGTPRHAIVVCRVSNFAARPCLETSDASSPPFCIHSWPIPNVGGACAA